MTSQLLQFAASLAAIVGLVWLAHALGFSASTGFDGVGEAEDIVRLLPGGFDPAETQLDLSGRAAICRDQHGRIALALPHGAQFVPLLLTPPCSAQDKDGILSINMPGSPADGTTLQLGKHASRWAELIRMEA